MGVAWSTAQDNWEKDESRDPLLQSSSSSGNRQMFVASLVEDVNDKLFIVTITGSTDSNTRDLYMNEDDMLLLSEDSVPTQGSPFHATSVTDLINGHGHQSGASLEGFEHWPTKYESVVEGDLILGGLMMVHEREDSVTCGPIMPQGGIQALEAMLYTLDRVNEMRLLPNFTLGAHILDDCDKDTYGLEMAVDFIKGTSPSGPQNNGASGGTGGWHSG